jgi:hypothetical protein
MKRFLMVSLMLGVIGFTATAQRGFTVGARLGPGFAFNELNGDIKNLIVTAFNMNGIPISTSDVSDKSNTAFVLSAYGSYMIFPKFSIQAELGLMANNGMALSVYGLEILKGSYTSLDLPVLARYEFFETPVSLSVLGGPYLSFGLGKFKMEMTGSPSEEVDIDGIRFGITMGVAAGYKVGPGSIIADLRFLTDFAPVKVKYSGGTMDVFTRRGINLTVGYEMKF